MHVIIVRYAEIALKGANRGFFEKRLAKNIKDCLSQHGAEDARIVRRRGRIFIYSGQTQASQLQPVFGLSSVSDAEEIGSTIDEIESAVRAIAASRPYRTFRISVQRLDKAYPLSSGELEKQLGSIVVAEFGKSVDLKHPELNIQVEILDKAYVFCDRVPCLGGLPVGIEGRALCLVEDERSLLAAILVMRRGCSLQLAIRGTVDITPLLRYSYGPPVVYQNIAAIDELGAIAVQMRHPAVVVGDTLASYRELPVSCLVLRPLIGCTDKEISELSQKYLDR